MLELKLYKIESNSDFIKNSLIFGILLIGIYFVYPEASGSIFLIAIIAFIAYTFMSGQKKQAVGKIHFDTNHISIHMDQQVIPIKLSEMESLEIVYSGYKGKKVAGDFVPNFNKFSGTDNYIKIIMSNHIYEYKILFENKIQQNEFIALVEEWDGFGYDVSGVRINR